MYLLWLYNLGNFYLYAKLIFEFLFFLVDITELVRIKLQEELGQKACNWIIYQYIRQDDLNLAKCKVISHVDLICIFM